MASAHEASHRNMDLFPNDSSATVGGERDHDALQAAAERRLLQWAVCRRAIELTSLGWNAEEKLVWSLVYEQGFTQPAAAALLHCSERTIRECLRKLMLEVRGFVKGIVLSAGSPTIWRGVHERPSRRRSRSLSTAMVRLPGLERELRWLRGGSWIDLLDQSCRSNPVLRPMNDQELRDRDNPGASVMRPLYGE